MKSKKKNPIEREEKALENAVLDYLIREDVREMLYFIGKLLPKEDASKWAEALENELQGHSSGLVMVKCKTVKQQTQLEELLHEIYPDFNDQQTQVLAL